MASFETHLTVSTVVSGIVTIPLLSRGIIDTNQGILLLFFGVVGGMLPDIDADNAIPVKITFKILSLILPLLVLIHFAGEQPLAKIGLFWILASIGLYVVFTAVFLKLTTHRGIFHTVGMGLLLGETTTIFMIQIMHINERLAMLAGIYIFFGYLLHLLLDEIYSVDLLNVSLKRSFGTALKFVDKNNIFGSIVVNLSAMLLLFFLPDTMPLLKEISELFKTIHII